MLLAKLCPSDKIQEMGFMGSFKKSIDASARDGTPKTKQRRQNTYRKMNEEMNTLIRRVRETSIKRCLFEPFDIGRTTRKLLKRLGEFARINNDQRVSATGDSQLSGFVPVRCCYLALAEENSLRLPMHMILHIIAFATCFELGSTGDNYEQFSEYAAQKISFLTVYQTFDNRLEIIKKTADTPEIYDMNGLTEDMLLAHLKEKFEAIGEGNQLATEAQFCEMISSCPRAKFTDGETLAIVAACAREGGPSDDLKYQHIVPWIYAYAQTVYRERVIGRRLILLDAIDTGGFWTWVGQHV